MIQIAEQKDGEAGNREHNSVDAIRIPQEMRFVEDYADAVGSLLGVLTVFYSVVQTAMPTACA